MFRLTLQLSSFLQGSNSGSSSMVHLCSFSTPAISNQIERQAIAIHFQSLYLVLRKHSKAVGFGFSLLLLTNHTLMLTLWMF
ncbi:hypothetical protein QN277_017153 [Acacia crassicarpa]|uniref:Uncharacterized protein n=1 Tax=Acacia crassicarpa TaxID=499986 RepID=A0AAE1MQ61_9FABA|nr:hypothetical protein QN277_017153 [Acacia crassicarpa]